MKESCKLRKWMGGILLAAAVLCLPAIRVFANDSLPAGGGVLHIEKHVGTSGSGPATGHVQSDAAGATVSGLRYDVYRVEQTTHDSQSDKADYPSSPVSSVDGSGSTATACTDSAGKTWKLSYITGGSTGEDGKLDIRLAESALYLVLEDKTCAAKTAVYTQNGVKHTGGLIAAGPFLVSVPMTDPEGESAWLTDVYVYPKNDEATLVKTADASSVDVGGERTFSLYSPVAAQGVEGGRVVMQSQTISDTLNPAFTVDADRIGEQVTLEMTKSAMSDAVAQKDSSTGYTALKEGEDYQLSVSGQKVTAELTKKGIYSLYGSTDGSGASFCWKTLRMTLKVTVNEKILDQDHLSHTAPNTFEVKIQNRGEDPYTLTSPAVYIHTGVLTVRKTGSDGTLLQGAKFKISATAQEAQEQIYIRIRKDGSLVRSGAEGYEDAVDYEVTTGEDGRASFCGLACCDGKTTPCMYYLTETEAPDGYQQSTEIKVAEFASHNMFGSDDFDEAVTVVKDVENEPISDIPKKPEDTDTPKNPDTPDTPKNPDTPGTTTPHTNTPSTGTTPGISGDTPINKIIQYVKTGDVTAILPYVLSAAAALIIILLLAKRKNKKAKKIHSR